MTPFASAAQYVSAPAMTAKIWLSLNPLLLFVDLQDVRGHSRRSDPSSGDGSSFTVLRNHLRVDLDEFPRLRAANDKRVGIEARVSAGVVVGRARRRMRLPV